MSEHESKNNVKTQSKHLTSREIEVLKLVTMGKSNTEIAKDLGLSVHTIKAHVCSILHKFGVGDRVQAAVMAVKQKIVP